MPASAPRTTRRRQNGPASTDPGCRRQLGRYRRRRPRSRARPTVRRPPRKKLRARTGTTSRYSTSRRPGSRSRRSCRSPRHAEIPFDPDLVLFAYCCNDPVETDVRGLRNVEVSGWQPWSGLRPARGVPRGQNQVALWYDGRSRVYHGLETSFDKLAVMGASRRLLLVGMPLLTNDRAAQSHLPVIERLAKERGIPYLDLFPGLAARDLVSFAGKKYPDHIHYNEAGHEAIAELLSAELAGRCARRAAPMKATRKRRPVTALVASIPSRVASSSSPWRRKIQSSPCPGSASASSASSISDPATSAAHSWRRWRSTDRCRADGAPIRAVLTGRRAVRSHQ